MRINRYVVAGYIVTEVNGHYGHPMTIEKALDLYEQYDIPMGGE